MYGMNWNRLEWVAIVRIATTTLYIYVRLVFMCLFKSMVVQMFDDDGRALTHSVLPPTACALLLLNNTVLKRLNFIIVIIGVFGGMCGGV